jgi:hypothetical protein
MPVCLNHTDTDAVTRCYTCGKPLCARCIVQKDGNDYCSEYCAEKGQLAGKRSDGVLDSKSAVNKAKRRRNIILFIILIILIGGGAWYYSQNKKEVDKKLDKLGEKAEKLKKSTEKTIKKHGSASEKAINDKIPESSKYKRNREGLVK